MKRRFIIELTTDGFDYTQNMFDLEVAIKRALPEIVRPYVRETAPAKVRYVAGWTVRKKKK